MTTLRELHSIGLDAAKVPFTNFRTAQRFSEWAQRDDAVYPSQEAAAVARPSAFGEACEEFCRAGRIGRTYPLLDGRTVRSAGIWWDAPEPGGRSVAYYFV